MPVTAFRMWIGRMMQTRLIYEVELVKGNEKCKIHYSTDDCILKKKCKMKQVFSKLIFPAHSFYFKAHVDHVLFYKSVWHLSMEEKYTTVARSR